MGSAVSNETRTTRRVAFVLHIREGMGEAYDKSHEAVRPEKLDLLTRCGVSEYSIFRSDTILLLVMSLLPVPKTELPSIRSGNASKQTRSTLAGKKQQLHSSNHSKDCEMANASPCCAKCFIYPKAAAGVNR